MNHPITQNGSCLNQTRHDPVLGNVRDTREPFKQLQRDIVEHDQEVSTPKSEGERSEALLVDSERLYSCLVELERGSCDTDGAGRKPITQEFREEILQILVSTHLRLLALTNEFFGGSGLIKFEIARTHGLMRNSAILLNTIRVEKTARPENRTYLD